jgi:hypothetical protein
MSNREEREAEITRLQTALATAEYALNQWKGLGCDSPNAMRVVIEAANEGSKTYQKLLATAEKELELTKPMLRAKDIIASQIADKLATAEHTLGEWKECHEQRVKEARETAGLVADMRAELAALKQSGSIDIRVTHNIGDEDSGFPGWCVRLAHWRLKPLFPLNDEGRKLAEALANMVRVSLEDQGLKQSGSERERTDLSHLDDGEFAPLSKCARCKKNDVIGEGVICVECAFLGSAQPADRESAPQEYVSKRVTKTAMRFAEDGSNWIAVHQFIGQQCPVNGTTFYVIIPTIEGDMRAKRGDWIIKGVNGEFYPCKPDIFAISYEPSAPAHADLQAAPDKEKWRVGTKVPSNVYSGDRPVCQCHSDFDAALIVSAVNDVREGNLAKAEREIKRLQQGWSDEIARKHVVIGDLATAERERALEEASNVVVNAIQDDDDPIAAIRALKHPPSVKEKK